MRWTGCRGTAYGYEKRIAYDLNGERTRGLQQIVPAQAAIVVRIFEDYAAGISPRSIVRRPNEEGVPSPRSGRRDRATSSNPPAWTPNTLTGNAERGTGMLNNQLYVGKRAYARQTYRKNPDTGKRHAFLNAEEQQATTVAAPDLRIVSDTLWQSVKDRQQSLRRGPRKARDAVPALPFFAQQRQKYLTSGKMTCGECGSSYAKSGRTRFGCQVASKKGPAFCGNRLTIRQDDLDARILSGLANEMVRNATWSSTCIRTSRRRLRTGRRPRQPRSWIRTSTMRSATSSAAKRTRRRRATHADLAASHRMLRSCGRNHARWRNST